MLAYGRLDTTFPKVANFCDYKTDTKRQVTFQARQVTSKMRSISLTAEVSCVAASGKTNCSQRKGNELQIPWITWPTT